MSQQPQRCFERPPDDVVFDILNRLPVKSIIRFRCVSKSLFSTITSPNFINKHLHRAKSLSNSNNHNGFLLSKANPVADSSEEDLCTVIYNNDYTLTEICRFKIPFDDARFLGFCNGIFCFATYSLRKGFYRNCVGLNGIIYLWNPSIRKIKELLATPLYEVDHGVTLGLAYHSQNNDIKVLRIVCLIGQRVPHIDAEVYTLSTDSWKRVDVLVESPITRINQSPCLFFNGALHSIAYTQSRKFILCFDVNDEIFREIMLPPHNYLPGLFQTLERLEVFKGSLALFRFGEGLCQIWVMKEYGVVESWTEHVVPVENVSQFFGCTGSGELVITKSIVPHQLFSFDPESRDENNLGILDPTPEAYIANFMESLVLLYGRLVI